MARRATIATLGRRKKNPNSEHFGARGWKGLKYILLYLAILPAGLHLRNEGVTAMPDEQKVRKDQEMVKPVESKKDQMSQEELGKVSGGSGGDRPSETVSLN